MLKKKYSACTVGCSKIHSTYSYIQKAVIDSIRQVKGNKTLLIVTHHMSLANECDIIYKIENKKFVRVF